MRLEAAETLLTPIKRAATVRRAPNRLIQNI